MYFNNCSVKIENVESHTNAKQIKPFLPTGVKQKNSLGRKYFFEWQVSFWDKALKYSLGWSRTYYVSKNDFEF